MHAPKAPTALAATALVVAVLGSAPLTHAAGKLILPKRSVGPAQIKKNAVTSAKVKNGTLTSADFNAGQLPAGAQGPKGERGDTGPKGDTGAKGEAGASGTAVAYARVVVNAGGATIDAAHSKGVTQDNVTRISTGTTCFKGLAFTPRTAVGSADVGDPGVVPTLGVALAPSPNVTFACGGDGQAAVVTVKSDLNVDASYYVIFE
jgi:hypothetical protein